MVINLMHVQVSLYRTVISLEASVPTLSIREKYFIFLRVRIHRTGIHRVNRNFLSQLHQAT